MSSDDGEVGDVNNVEGSGDEESFRRGEYLSDAGVPERGESLAERREKT